MSAEINLKFFEMLFILCYLRISLVRTWIVKIYLPRPKFAKTGLTIIAII